MITSIIDAIYAFYFDNGTKQNKKTMKEDYLLITTITYGIQTFYFDNGMKLNDGYTTNLDYLLQKSISYKHYYENYKENLELDLIPAGLNIKKLPAITPLKKELVNLLLIESSKKRKET